MRRVDMSRVDLNLLVVFDDLMHTRSVTETAARLHKTQPTISHALQRLREQLDDPLLVKQGRGLAPSPHAQALIASLRPLLSRIDQALSPPPPFEAASSRRRFALAAPDFAQSLLPTLLGRLRQEAPKVSLDWHPLHDDMLRSLVDGAIDVVVARSFARDPVEGLSHAELPALQWGTYMRAGHPAARRWSLQAWLKAEHVQVQFGDRQDNPVSERSRQAGAKRRVAARVPNLSMVGPLVAATDLLATLPMVAMTDAARQYQLNCKVPPLDVPAMPHRVYWSEQLDKDSALVWFRSHVRAVFSDQIQAAHASSARLAASSRR